MCTHFIRKTVIQFIILSWLALWGPGTCGSLDIWSSTHIDWRCWEREPCSPTSFDASESTLSTTRDSWLFSSPRHWDLASWAISPTWSYTSSSVLTHLHPYGAPSSSQEQLYCCRCYSYLRYNSYNILRHNSWTIVVLCVHVELIIYWKFMCPICGMQGLDVLRTWKGWKVYTPFPMCGILCLATFLCIHESKFKHSKCIFTQNQLKWVLWWLHVTAKLFMFFDWSSQCGCAIVCTV